MKAQGQSMILCFVVLMLHSLSALGQTQTQTSPPSPGGGAAGIPSSPGRAPTPEWVQKTEAYRRGLEIELRRRALNNRKPGVVVPIVATEEDLTAEERKALMPAAEDLKANAAFLRQSGTGIFRLMRVDKQNHGKVVSTDSLANSGDVLLVGGGAQYSFAKKNHNADKWSDLAWEVDWFLAGVAGEAIGVLVDLGDASLENIGLENAGLHYLTNFMPATTEEAAEQQFHQLEKGVTENGFSYGLSVSWKLYTTYALRSVNYGRSDVLVAFRPVRQDTNGSLIVLWKKLKSFNSPSLKKEPKK